MGKWHRGATFLRFNRRFLRTLATLQYLLNKAYHKRNVLVAKQLQDNDQM